ncbi:acyl-CoA Delta(11) desaturase-like [Ostrinia nubilalis]|uniref:acyl-CoA Delta(11) desaturase-like n=1 Tax=Ostrinia nubilalis TaxID=29057 RepID=UPI0030823686
MAETLTDPNENSTEKKLSKIKRESKTINQFVIWFTIVLVYLHLSALYGLYLCLTTVKWLTIGFDLLVYHLSAIGVTAGAHRLWSHRSYKAKFPLQVILMMFYSMSLQNTIINWARDHRVHHKCSDTDGDPHNANRGFFFSHIGWLVTKKSDEVKKQGNSMDMSDLYTNPVLCFQKKYALPLFGIFWFIIPTFTPMYFWGETLNNAWHMNILRYLTVMHVTLCVNSVAHKWGYKPYDKNILPSQNILLNTFAIGEGFHNYHHVFPWDYQAAEFGNKKLSLTTWFIDFFAKIGWAYDMKTASEEVVRNRAERTGDGTDLWGARDYQEK